MNSIPSKYNLLLYLFILLLSLSFMFLLDRGVDYEVIYTSLFLFIIGITLLFKSSGERFVFILSFIIGIVFLPLYTQ